MNRGGSYRHSLSFRNSTYTHVCEYPQPPQRSNHAPEGCSRRPPTVTHRTQVGNPTHDPKATQATTQSGHKTTHREKPLYISRGGGLTAHRPSRSAQTGPPLLAVATSSARFETDLALPYPIPCPNTSRQVACCECRLLCGCVGTANCPPRWAGSVGRLGRRGFWWG